MKIFTTTIKQKRDIMFYILVGFVCVILSIWMVSLISIKEQETQILQGQIDSLIYVIDLSHQKDTTFAGVRNLLPINKAYNVNKIDQKITLHAIIFGLIGVFVFLYIRCSRFSCPENNEKKPCLPPRKRKKTI